MKTLTKKQRNMFWRIIIAGIMFAVLEVLEHTVLQQWLGEHPWYGVAIYAVPYLIVGYDVLKKAVHNIRHGQVFDENLLMIIATFGAFGVQEFSEALAVMLFYQVGELFQGYAVGKSRANISELMDIVPEYANVEQDGVLTEVDPDDVEVGTVIVVKPGERISYRPVVGNPWAYCWMAFDGERADEYMREAGFEKGVYHLDAHVDISGFYNLCERVLSASSQDYSAALKRLGLLMEFIALAIESNERGRTHNVRREHKALYKKKDYIRYGAEYMLNYYASINVGDVSK